MKKDGGGNWNRAARKSGGQRATFPAFTTNASWVEWSNAVAEMVKTATGRVLHDEVGKEQLLAWFDAGERPSWAANVVVRFINSRSQ